MSMSEKTTYRVVWGLGRHEDFTNPLEAAERQDEIHADMVRTWPELGGTGDGALPRVVVLESSDEQTP